MSADLNGPRWELIRQLMIQDLETYGNAIPTKEDKEDES